MLVYFLAPRYNQNCNKTLQHWLRKSFFKEIKGPAQGVGRKRKTWRSLEPGDDVLTICSKTHASQLYLRIFVVVPDVLRKFSKIERIFSSPEEVCDLSFSWNYIILSVTDNFGSGKWAKIERNDVPGKLHRV